MVVCACAAARKHGPSEDSGYHRPSHAAIVSPVPAGGLRTVIGAGADSHRAEGGEVIQVDRSPFHRSRADQQRRWSPRGAARRGLWCTVVAAAVAVAVAGCSSAPSAAPRAPGRITLELHLATTRAVVGSTITGSAVLQNNTSRSLRVEACPQSWVVAGLVGRGVSFDPAFTTGALDCFGTFRVGPHKSRSAPISIETTYDGCGGSGVPPCPGGNRFPLLPLGTYRVKVILTWLPKGTVVVEPAHVTLLSASTGRPSGPEGGALLVQSYGCETSKPQPPLSVRVTHDGTVVARWPSLAVTQEEVVPLAPGTYFIRSNVRGPQGVRIFNGLLSSRVVLKGC